MSDKREETESFLATLTFIPWPEETEEDASEENSED
jgi:hypothetical protein